MAVPPTVADLDAEVTQRCGLVLADAGLFLRALDAADAPVTPAVRQGLRRGVLAVGVTIADPLNLADSDIVALSPFAVERALDEAELYSLQQVLAHWWRVTENDQPALSAAPMAGGWRREQRQSVKDRVSELKAICERPYREPSSPISVAHADARECEPGHWGYINGYGPWGWPGRGW